MKDYRPISCCNVIYKVISKIIANRLKVLLPEFVAGNQSAFVKDRLLIENLLLATELVKDYYKDSVSTRCAIKIDISKAFDSVQWSFLLNVLLAMNFPAVFIHWIKLCITTASFSVQVNGDLAGYFQSARGLRQGCSLSPYLFVISMDVLSKMLDKAAGAHKFGFHPHCQRLKLTHLSFADDLMVLTDGKSTMYMAGVSPLVKAEIAALFPFDIGQLPVRYLGLPLVTKRLTAEDYAPLLEQIRKRIASWTSRYLSYAGRLNLIQSILWSICNFWLGAFRLPRQCIREIDKICSAYLWSGLELSSKKAKISWEKVCKPKIEGGLGLRSLTKANDVCCLKLVWRIISNSKSLWVQWVTTYLLRRKHFWTLKQNTNAGSWIWRKILKYRDKAK
ncbi:putative RNA-directed DNA polymerase [Arabidopsis thaliana]